MREAYPAKQQQVWNFHLRKASGAPALPPSIPRDIKAHFAFGQYSQAPLIM